ncbi:MAG TPA: DUF4926 domain-containing protein [Pseudonocardiaceae bacterium]|jgi:hypothetical protein
MAETHVDDWVAQRYERLWPELFDPAVVEPAVNLLVDLAGDGPALELGIVEAVDLNAGAIGSLVAAYDTGTSEHEYEIEFVDDDGSILALITVKESAVERAEGQASTTHRRSLQGACQLPAGGTVNPSDTPDDQDWPAGLPHPTIAVRGHRRGRRSGAVSAADRGCPRAR